MAQWLSPLQSSRVPVGSSSPRLRVFPCSSRCDPPPRPRAGARTWPGARAASRATRRARNVRVVRALAPRPRLGLALLLLPRSRPFPFRRSSLLTADHRPPPPRAGAAHWRHARRAARATHDTRRSRRGRSPLFRPLAPRACASFFLPRFLPALRPAPCAPLKHTRRPPAPARHAPVECAWQCTRGAPPVAPAHRAPSAPASRLAQRVRTSFALEGGCRLRLCHYGGCGAVAAAAP